MIHVCKYVWLYLCMCICATYTRAEPVCVSYYRLLKIYVPLKPWSFLRMEGLMEDTCCAREREYRYRAFITRKGDILQS